MPDNRIGMSIDVRDNGGVSRLQRDFKDVATTAKDLKAQFDLVDKSVSQLVTRGWGSDRYTSQLRDQLSSMRQISNLLERQARVTGNEEVRTQAKSMSQQIQQSNRDLQSISTRSTLSGIGRQGLSNAGRWIGNAAIAYAGYQGFNSLRSGYNDAKAQLGPFADIAKTMAPGGGTQDWANAMLASGQGFGFTNDQIISGAGTIKNAAGANRNFFNQIHGVAQFGRQYGFDFNQAANYFAGAFQNGVTGGSNAQMSWQQYAILVANTVQKANMQGREGQVVNTLQQLTQQLSAQNMSAPNQQGMAGLFATAGKTGNQNLINNFGGIMSAVNGGIQSPGLGPMGQAAMWQAVAPGQNFWSAQLQMSKGNTPQNFENVMKFAYSHFGGNTPQAAVMLGQWLGVSPSQAQTLIQTYMPNGQFSSNPVSTSHATSTQPNMSALDKTQQNFVSSAQGKQGFMSNFLGAFSNLSAFGGTHPLISAGISGTLGAASVWAGKNLFKSTFRGGIVGRAASSIGNVAGKATSNTGGFLDGVASKLGIAADDIMGPLGAVIGVTSLPFNKYLQRMENYTRSHPNIQGRWDPSDPNAPWNKGLPHFASGGFVNQPTVAMVGEDGPEAIVPLRGGVANTRSNPMTDAQKIVTTILALRPWKNQIESVFGSSTSGGNSGLGTTRQSSLVSMSNLMQMSMMNPNSASTLPFVNYMTGGSTGSYTGTGTKSFVDQFKPIALQAAQSLGIPTQYQNNFAEFAVSQWGLESGWGTSQDSKGDNNFGGIKYYSGLAGLATPGQGASDGGGYAHFNSPSAFGQGYSYFLSHNSNYASFLNAARSGASPQELINLIAQSGYATDPNYASSVRGALGGVQSYYGSASSVAAPNNVKVTLSAAPVKVQLTDSAGNPVGSTLVHFTTKATYNGQQNTNQSHFLQSLLR